MKKFLFFTLLIIFSIFVLSCEKKIKDEIIDMEVVFTIGDNKLICNNEESPIKTGVRVGKNHKIITGNSSVLVLKFKNGVIKIGPNSEINVEDILRKVEVSLNRGSLYIKVENIKDLKGFAIKTTTLNAAVRGTLYSVSHNDDISRVSVLKGVISVTLKDEKEERSIIIDTQKTIEVSFDEEKNIRVQEYEVDEKVKEELKNTEEIYDKIAEIENSGEFKENEKREKIEEYLKEIINIENNDYNESKEKFKDDELEDKKEMNLKTSENKKNQGKKERLDKNNTFKIDREKKEDNKKSQDTPKMTIQEIKEKYKILSEITLFNGKRIKGAIIRRDDNNIYFMTENGEIRISKDEVSEIKTIEE